MDTAGCLSEPAAGVAGIVMVVRKPPRKNKTPIRLEQIAEGVLVSYSDPLSDRPALGAIIGDSETLMIDAGASPAHANSFVAELHRQTGKKPTVVCLTHWHWDHSFGLPELDIPSYAHQRCIGHLAALGRMEWTADALNNRVLAGQELAFTRDMMLAEYREGEAIRIGIPAFAIGDGQSVDLGNRSVEIAHMDSDHSDDCLAILDSTTGTLFLGDVCHPDYYAKPPRYTPRKVIALFNKINSMAAHIVVEGHEEPQSRMQFLAGYASLLTVASACMAGERDRSALFALASERSPSADPHETRTMIHAMLAGCST